MIKTKIIKNFSQPHVIRVAAYAHRFTRHVFVLSPSRESPRHLNQNFSSSFFEDEGFLPAKEALGMSFSVRIMLLSADEELDNAIIAVFDFAEAFPTSFPRSRIQAALGGGH